MATLQVKNLPDGLHAELRRRARSLHTTMSELVVEMLRRDLSLPTLEDWLAEVRQVPARAEDIDVGGLLDDVRAGIGGPGGS